jgi:dTDP-4-dehydrorhamnose 3,5-epimerase
MIFRELPLSGVFVIELEPSYDERGFFARTFCVEEFSARGLNPEIRQCSISFNQKRGTLRGMHHQAEPHGEEKIVRCSRGAVYDVIVDVRRDSPTRGRWESIELTAENGRMLYVPRGLAHGFQTLVDGTEVVYQISTDYRPDAFRGIRWDDPTIDIRWPEVSERIISERDRKLPFFEAALHP